MLRFGPSMLGSRNARERTGKNIETITVANAIHDVILQPRGLFSLREAKSFGAIFHWLSNEQMWCTSYLCADFTPGFFVASESKVTLSGQSPQLETVRLFKHHLSLVQISQPVGLHRWQNWRFPEVEADDRIGKMHQATVIGELRSDAVHDRYRALSNTVDQTRNPEMTFSLEY